MAIPDRNEARQQGDTAVDMPVVRIEATSGWRAVNFGELWEYRDLFGMHETDRLCS
jgi:hypothetical protein